METKNNFNRNIIALLLFGIVFLAVGSLFVLGGRGANDISAVKIGGQEIKIILALTKEEQATGLSGRRDLDAGQGMLFVFDQPGKHLFWMKNMNFPIDIIWLREDKRIVYIKENADPEDYLKTYGPEDDSLYVLEVNAGFARENNVRVGDEVEFVY